MRTRAAVLCTAVAALTLLVQYTVTWTQVSDFRERGSDFSTYYVAAMLVREGRGTELYDQQLEQQRHLEMLPAGSRVTLPFVTPPPTALLAVPLTLLDPVTASRAFSLAELALLVLALVIAARAAPWPKRGVGGARAAVVLAALAGVPTFVLFLLGQLDAIAALGLAAAYACWRRGHPGWAGFWLALGFIVVKPHLGVGLAVFLVARRDWRAIAGATAGAVAVVLVSLPVIGVSGFAGFAAGFGYSIGSTPEVSTMGLPGMVASWLGTGSATALVSLAAAVAALGGCALLGARSRAQANRLEAALAGSVALSLAVSPHLFTYDVVTLAPAFVWCMGRLATEERAVAWPGRLSLAALGGWVLGNLVVNLDVGNAAPAPPGRLVPWVLVLAGVLAARACAGRRTATRMRPAWLQSESGSGTGGSSA